MSKRSNVELDESPELNKSPETRRPTIGDLRLPQEDEEDEEDEDETESDEKVSAEVSEEDPNYFSFEVTVPETGREYSDYKKLLEILEETAKEPGGMFIFGNVNLTRITRMQSAYKQMLRLAKQALKETKSKKLMDIVEAFDEFNIHMNVWTERPHPAIREIISSRLDMITELKHSLNKALKMACTF